MLLLCIDNLILAEPKRCGDAAASLLKLNSTKGHSCRDVQGYSAAMCFDFFWLRFCAKAMVSLNWTDVKKEIQDKDHIARPKKNSIGLTLSHQAPTCVFCSVAL